MIECEPDDLAAVQRLVCRSVAMAAAGRGEDGVAVDDDTDGASDSTGYVAVRCTAFRSL